MNERTIRVLEFDKIKRKLIEFTVSGPGKEIAEELVPYKDYSKIHHALMETNDGTAFILRKGRPPIEGYHDIRGSLKRVEIGAVLSPGELLKISGCLRVSRNLKS